MSDIAKRKLAEAAKQLKDVEREQNAAHNIAHKLDQHDESKKGGKPAPIVGGNHKQRRDTVLQRRLKANATSTRGTDVPTRTLLQKQIAANPALFEGEIKP